MSNQQPQSTVRPENDQSELASTVRKFFGYLDRTEESGFGREFHPVRISCCRALWTDEISKVLDDMKRLVAKDSAAEKP